MKFACQTLFDITATGTTGHYRHGRLDYQDRAAQLITDQATWNLSCNQQRNWETITQILSLRTQLFGLTDPIVDQTGTRWMFEFETETDGVYGPESDPVSVLKSDAAGVPMLGGLKNQPELAPVLITEGPDKNIWFAAVPINTR